MSTPTSFDADDDITTLLSTAVADPPVISKDTAEVSSLTGEFLTTRERGVSVDDIGSVNAEKNVRIVCLTEDKIAQLCCGYIGVKKQSFCVKHKNDCSVATHGLVKATPLSDHYYIFRHPTEDSVWSQFFIARSKILERDPSIPLYPNEALPVKRWKAIFDGVSSSAASMSDSEMHRTINFIMKPPEMADLKTPSKSLFEKNEDTFSSVKRALKSDTERLILTTEDRSKWEEVLPGSLVQYVGTMGTAMAELSLEFAKIKKEVPALEDVSRDLLDLWSGIKGIQCSIVTDNQGIFSDFWSGLLELEC